MLRYLPTEFSRFAVEEFDGVGVAELDRQQHDTDKYAASTFFYLYINPVSIFLSMYNALGPKP